MPESLHEQLRRYRREIRKKDPELYQKMLNDGGLTDQDVLDTLDKLERITQEEK